MTNVNRGAPKIAIPMPWTGRYYCINFDDIRRGRRVFMVAWGVDYGVFFLRMGWAYRF